MSRRSVRITPLGYIVLSIIILVMLVGIYFIVWSMRGSNDDQENLNLDSNSTSMTPTPSLAPVGDQTQESSVTTDTATPEVTTTPAETPTMTPKQDDTPEPAVKTPSPEQVASAVDGTLKSKRRCAATRAERDIFDTG